MWTVPRDAFQAGQLAIRPPANSDADMRITIIATTLDGDDRRETGTSASIIVRAVADAPQVQVADARGLEDSPIRLAGLGASLNDRDGSEKLSFTLAGVPATASLSAGTRNTDGTWSLTPAQLATVSITPLANFSGSMNPTLTAVATEGADGAALSDTDGSESIVALSIGGLPAGFTLSAGTVQPDGSVAVRPADLGALRMTPPADWNGTVNLTLSATVKDGASTRTTALPFSVSVAVVNDAPTLQLVGPARAATGQAQADVIHDSTITDVDSAMMASPTITLAGAGTGDRFAFADHPPQVGGGRTVLGSTGIEATTGANGSVTLSGRVSAATYAEVLEGMVLENASSAGLASGVRTIGVTLRDEAGAAAAAQNITLDLQPSRITGNGTNQALTGTAGHDSFLGSAGDEHMRGGAGADIFLSAMGGGHDTVEGGNGAWTDEIRLTGTLSISDWTLVLDQDVQAQQGTNAMNFSQPASGHIQFADGGQLEFSQIERIT